MNAFLTSWHNGTLSLLFPFVFCVAARMESNGIAGKIQVSQETADKLTLAGKSHWLTQREDKITAKGKGLLQTYWVEIISAAAASRSRAASKLTSMTSGATSTGSTDGQHDSEQSDESSQEGKALGGAEEVLETTDYQVSDEFDLDSDFEDDDSEVLYHC